MRDKYIQNFCVILEVNLGMLEGGFVFAPCVYKYVHVNTVQIPPTDFSFFSNFKMAVTCQEKSKVGKLVNRCK